MIYRFLCKKIQFFPNAYLELKTTEPATDSGIETHRSCGATSLRNDVGFL